jgi:hypothetical protein
MVLYEGFCGPRSSEAGGKSITPLDTVVSAMFSTLSINCYYSYNCNGLFTFFACLKNYTTLRPICLNARDSLLCAL